MVVFWDTCVRFNHVLVVLWQAIVCWQSRDSYPQPLISSCWTDDPIHKVNPNKQSVRNFHSSVPLNNQTKENQNRWWNGNIPNNIICTQHLILLILISVFIDFFLSFSDQTSQYQSSRVFCPCDSSPCNEQWPPAIL